MLRKKYAVILSASEGSRMATHGVLFPGFFVAALLRMTGGEHVGAGVLDSPCAAAGNLPVILRCIAPENDRLLL